MCKYQLSSPVEQDKWKNCRQPYSVASTKIDGMDILFFYTMNLHSGFGGLYVYPKTDSNVRLVNKLVEFGRTAALNHLKELEGDFWDIEAYN